LHSRFSSRLNGRGEIHERAARVTSQTDVQLSLSLSRDHQSKKNAILARFSSTISTLCIHHLIHVLNMHRCGNSYAPELLLFLFLFLLSLKKLTSKNVLEPQILALKSHFFGSCVFVSGSHQFFFMRFITKSFKFPWRSSQLKITDHRRFKAFFFFFFFLFFRESVRSVLCLTQFRHFSAFFIPTRKFCARKIRSNSSTPIDRSWLPNFCNAKMLHRRAMGFCLQKTRKQKPWSSTWPRDVGRHVQETKIYLIRRSSAAWFFASVTNLPST